MLYKEETYLFRSTVSEAQGHYLGSGKDLTVDGTTVTVIHVRRRDHGDAGSQRGFIVLTIVS